MTPPDTECELRAERALLGALLAEPHRIASVAGWLRADDLAEPRNRVVYGLLADQARHGHTTGPEQLLEVLQRRGELRRGHLDGGYLTWLLAASPQPRHAVSYGRMVLEASIARTVQALADRIAQAGEDGPGRVFARAALAGGLLDATQERWQESGPHENRALTDTSETRSAVLASDRVGARRPAAPADVEDAALGALVAAPGELLEVARWLRPGDFAAPGRAQAYAALLAVRGRGAPVDPVAVMWEARKHGAFGPGGPAPQLLAAADGAPVPGHAVTAARRVLAASIQRHAVTTADTLGGLSRRPDVPVTQLLAGSRRRVQDLGRDRRRWDAAAGVQPAGASVASATAAR